MNCAERVGKVVKLIEQRFGKNTVMTLEDGMESGVSVVSTGSLRLDQALGCGGVPRGRIVEIFGPESSGKTTLALHLIAEMQKAGGLAAFIDAEHALDPTYAEALGVKISELLLSQPDCGEQALDICDAMVQSGALSVIVVDSVAALIPKSELEGAMGDPHMGLQARLMSQALRKLTGPCAKNDCMVVFINQIRQKIGVVFGNPETTTGGNALKFYASVRLDVRRVSTIKEKEEILGNRTRVKVVKNKMAPPFRTAEFDIIFGKGIDRQAEILDSCTEAGIIEKAGAWYSHDGRQLGQGRAQALQALEADPELAERLRTAALTVPAATGAGAQESA